MSESVSNAAIFTPEDERDAPIEVYFGSPTLDLGIAAIPKILPRFWTRLVSDGEHLNDRQYALLVQVLLLRNAQDYELRVGNLPMAGSSITLERDKKVLRRMGLVFTERVYYPAQSGKPPRMQAQRWDLRSLFFNLEQVALTWKTNQNEVIAGWERYGRKGRKPVYNFPAAYTHEVALPMEVAMDIVKGTFYPVAEKWLERAQLILKCLPTELNPSGRLPTGRFWSGTPTEPNKSGTLPTGPDSSGHLLKDDEDEEEETTTLTEQIFTYFARRKGDLDYQPTTKEQRALEKLLANGFTLKQIIAGIDAAFSRPSKPRHFTHCAAIARDLARLQQESRQPETRNRSALADSPETRQPEAQFATDEDSADRHEETVPQSEIIETYLARAVDVYRSAGREITGDLLARFRLMAMRCDAAASLVGVTGSDWLADALMAALGVAKPGNLLNYADAVLTDWIANGRDEKPPKQASKPKPARRNHTSGSKEPGVHQGIRDYLEKQGGMPHGEPD